MVLPTPPQETTPPPQTASLFKFSNAALVLPSTVPTVQNSPFAFALRPKEQPGSVFSNVPQLAAQQPLPQFAAQQPKKVPVTRRAMGTSLPPNAGVAGVSRFFKFLQLDDDATRASKAAGWLEEVKTSPLFTWHVKQVADTGLSPSDSSDSDDGVVVSSQQYAVIGHETRSPNRPNATINTPIFLNTNAPWSAFICGSQGSGKSYTLSCMLESCLLPMKALGHTPKPLTGLVFSYDPHASEAVCEAAFLASHVPIRVIVSPSNFHNMERLYKGLPGIGQQIEVIPLLLKNKHLNTQRMLRLMAFSEKDGAVPLYMEMIISVLKEMALESRGAQGLNYQHFIKRLKDLTALTKDQKGPMNMRLQLLESFMVTGPLGKHLPKSGLDIFASTPGCLTIVDLTDPFVDPGSACVLFDIALALFMESNKTVGKVVALDEAHKFMTESNASQIFTDSLLTLIREQRHKAVRTIIATQEPTISPKLLDLCSMTFVHRFTSPDWLITLKQRLAVGQDPVAMGTLFSEIIGLDVGEALLFSPSAMLDVEEGQIKKLGVLPVRFRTRKRVTRDGGRSIMAAGNDTDESD